MELREARNLFVDRLLNWSLAECERETLADYPMMRMQRNDATSHAFAYLSTLSLSDQLSLASARVKNNFVYLKGPILTADDRQAFEAWRHGCTWSGEAFPRIAILDGKLAHSKDDLKLFRPKLARALAGELGLRATRLSSAQWFIARNLGDWSFGISMDFGGRWEPELRLRQQVYRIDAEIGNVRDNSLLMPFVVALAECLGFSQTAWGFAYYSNLDEIVQPVIAQAQYALAALPKMIDGLDI